MASQYDLITPLIIRTSICGHKKFEFYNMKCAIYYEHFIDFLKNWSDSKFCHTLSGLKKDQNWPQSVSDAFDTPISIPSQANF